MLKSDQEAPGQYEPEGVPSKWGWIGSGCFVLGVA